MPAILSPNNKQEWLNPDLELEQVLKLLKPYSDEEMKKNAVSTLINSPKNDTPELLYPVE